MPVPFISDFNFSSGRISRRHVGQLPAGSHTVNLAWTVSGAPTELSLEVNGARQTLASTARSTSLNISADTTLVLHASNASGQADPYPITVGVNQPSTVTSDTAETPGSGGGEAHVTAEGGLAQLFTGNLTLRIPREERDDPSYPVGPAGAYGTVKAHMELTISAVSHPPDEHEEEGASADGGLTIDQSSLEGEYMGHLRGSLPFAAGMLHFGTGLGVYASGGYPGVIEAGIRGNVSVGTEDFGELEGELEFVLLNIGYTELEHFPHTWTEAREFRVDAPHFAGSLTRNCPEYNWGQWLPASAPEWARNLHSAVSASIHLEFEPNWTALADTLWPQVRARIAQAAESAAESTGEAALDLCAAIGFDGLIMAAFPLGGFITMVCALAMLAEGDEVTEECSPATLRRRTDSVVSGMFKKISNSGAVDQHHDPFGHAGWWAADSLFESMIGALMRHDSSLSREQAIHRISTDVLANRSRYLHGTATMPVQNEFHDDGRHGLYGPARPLAKFLTFRFYCERHAQDGALTRPMLSSYRNLWEALFGTSVLSPSTPQQAIDLWIRYKGDDNWGIFDESYTPSHGEGTRPGQHTSSG